MTVYAGRLGEFWGGFNANPVTGNMTPGDATTDPLDVGYTGVAFVSNSVVDISLNGNTDDLETTVHNSYSATPGPAQHSTARTYIPNFHDETLDVSMRYNEADTCQKNMLEAAFQSYIYNFWYLPDGDHATAVAGNHYIFFGAAFSTSFSPSSPLDDVNNVDFTLRLSGTDYAQL